MDELSKEVKELRKQGTAPAAAAPPPAAKPAPSEAQGMPTPTPKAVAKEAPKEPLFEKFLKGFYGTLDVSFDDVTKGINGLTAYQYSLSDPTNPYSTPIQGAPSSP